MSASRLRPNASNTQVLWLSSRHNIDGFTVLEVPVLSFTVGIVRSACELSIVIDSRLSMANHMASVCCSAYYHLQQIRSTLHWLPVRRHVNFRLATLMFKLLHGYASSFLSDACKSAPEASLCLRSSAAITCIIPWSRTRLSDSCCLLHCRSDSLPIPKTVESLTFFYITLH